MTEMTSMTMRPPLMINNMQGVTLKITLVHHMYMQFAQIEKAVLQSNQALLAEFGIDKTIDSKSMTSQRERVKISKVDVTGIYRNACDIPPWVHKTSIDIVLHSSDSGSLTNDEINTARDIIAGMVKKCTGAKIDDGDAASQFTKDFWINWNSENHHKWIEDYLPRISFEMIVRKENNWIP